MINYNNQTVELYDVENARQLGGYINLEGKKVKDHRLIRTAALNKADTERLSSFCRKYKIKDIVDLRTPGERETSPDPEIDGTVNSHVSVLGKNITISGQEKEMMDRTFETEDFAMRYIKLYEMGMPLVPDLVYESLFFSEEGIGGFRRFFDIVLSSGEDCGVLFHCTQGKDRTGIAAAMLLMALGVDEETIASDYMLTNVAYADKLDRIRTEIPKVTDDKTILEFALFIESVRIEYFKKPQERILKEYGSFLTYIKKEIGLSEGDITELKALYLD